MAKYPIPLKILANFIRQALKHERANCHLRSLLKSFYKINLAYRIPEDVSGQLLRFTLFDKFREVRNLIDSIPIGTELSKQEQDISDYFTLYLNPV